MMFHLYFSRYKLFNYEYVHIVITNALYLNFFSFFSLLQFRKAKDPAFPPFSKATDPALPQFSKTTDPEFLKSGKATDPALLKVSKATDPAFLKLFVRCGEVELPAAVLGQGLEVVLVLLVAGPGVD